MTNRCPITYEPCGTEKYSLAGLKLLSTSLKNLKDFPYTPKEQVQMAARLGSKMSIQGVQPKLSVILNVKEEVFEVVENGGRFIVKPPHDLYNEVPQNEDLTMRLAALVGIQVPLHGMVYNIDGSLSYFIRRFDRVGNQKVATEDFSQLLEFSRDTKYESSMEQVAFVIEKHCTFPVIEKLKLFRLVIFNYLVGNEDMHLKNFSLIRLQNKVELSPAYDLLNTSIIMPVKEEIALPLKGKKSKLNRKIFVDYFGKDRLGLSEESLSTELLKFENILSSWMDFIQNSFLSEKMREQYVRLIESRWNNLT